MRRHFLNPSISVLLLFLSSSFILSSICNRSVNAEVITLTADTFDDKLCFDMVRFAHPNLSNFEAIRDYPLVEPPDFICFDSVVSDTRFVWSVGDSPILDVHVQEKDTAWFVKFCAPWCKHCKKLGTLWEDLGKEMEGEDEIEIGEVDCATDKPVCSKVDIHSYPTFKLFYNGEEVAKFQGKRSVESLKTFAIQETEKAAAKALEKDADL